MHILLKKKKLFMILLTLFFLAGVSIFTHQKLSENTVRPNIIFILVDALRADHLGCYGYARDTSPNIDRIAGQGILFSNFYSVSSWTNPMIVSLFTGLYPQGILPAESHMGTLEQILPDLPTLAKILSQSGYRTIFLNDHPALNKSLHYDQGFDIFKELWHEPGWQQDWGGVHPDVFLKNVSEELDISRGERKPFFLLLHILYPHAPYNPPPPYDTLFGAGYKEINPQERTGMINAYDGEIRYADNLIGRIFDLVQKKQYSGKTYIVITSDHGEGFYEHGMWEHGNTLYNEVLHTPLIIYPPGGRSRESKQVSFLTSSIDLFPTIMDFARVSNFPTIDGESLMRFFRPGNKKLSVATIFSEGCYSFCVESTAMQNTRYKIILHPEKGLEVYDKYLDPLERKNIAAGMDTTSLKAMDNRILQHKIMNKERQGLYQIQRTKLDQEAMEKIRSLGYLQ